MISMQWLNPNERRRWVVLAVVCLGQLMMVLDATIVNVALPSIQGDLHFTQANLTWVVDAYLIAFGSILVTVALMLGVYAIVKATDYGWGSAHTLGFGAASLALLAAFVALEARLENPIFPLRILRVPGLAGSSAVRGLLVTGMFSTFFLGVLYLEHVRGYGALRTGVAFLPLTLGLAALSLGASGRLMERFGPRRVLLAGLTSITAALLLLSRVGEHASYFPGIFVPFTLLGVGAGMAFLPLMTLAMANVPSQDAGLA